MQRKNRSTSKHRKRSVKRRIERVAKPVETISVIINRDDKRAREYLGSGASEDVVIASTDTATERIAEVAVVEKMGADHSMNTIEVNEQQLNNEVQAVLAAAPLDQPQDTENVNAIEGERQPTPEEIHKGYAMIAGAGFGWASQTFAPNWAVQPSELDPLSSAIADACMLWFPDTPIPPKYLVLLVVAKAAVDIVGTRRDPKTGKLKSLYAPKQPDAAPAQTEAT